MIFSIYLNRYRERGRYRQTNRETDRKTYKEADSHTESHTESQTDRPTDRPTYRQTYRQTDIHRESGGERERERGEGRDSQRCYSPTLRRVNRDLVVLLGLSGHKKLRDQSSVHWSHGFASSWNVVEYKHVYSAGPGVTTSVTK